MLDAIKGLAGGGRAQKQTDDLHLLIATAKEERSALSAMLTQVSMRSSKLAQVGKSLEQVDDKAAATAARLDALVARIHDLEERSRTFGDVEKRVQSLLDKASDAQQAAEKLVAPDSELHTHRRQLQQLSSQALETQASIDALKKERATLDEFQ